MDLTDGMENMRKPVIAAMFGALILVVAGIALSGWFPVRSAASLMPAGSPFVPADPPSAAPPVRFTDGAGRPVSLADFSGKVVLVNLWATWCGPCVKEMPSLDRLQGQMGGSDFAVVALSVDRGGLSAVAPFFRRIGVRSLPVYLDPAGVSLGQFHVRGLPTTILVDRRGHERGRAEGAVDWTGADAEAVIGRLIGRGGMAGGGVVKAATP